MAMSGGSIPLFTVTMKSNGSTSEKDRLSRAIHAASIAAGYPADDLFQRSFGWDHVTSGLIGRNAALLRRKAVAAQWVSYPTAFQVTWARGP